MSDVQGLTLEEQRVYEEGPTLLAAAQRCNRYVASDFTPVYVEDVKVCVRHKSGEAALNCETCRLEGGVDGVFVVVLGDCNAIYLPKG